MERKIMDEIRFAHEAEVYRLERNNRRWFILSLILITVLVATNGAWIYYENQYEDVVYTENTQDGEGVNIIGNGDIHYGAETGNGQNTP